jgi:hypothetical protein
MFAAEEGQFTAADMAEPSLALDPKIDFITLDVTKEEERKDVVAGIVDRRVTAPRRAGAPGRRRTRSRGRRGG